jgi:DNA-binding transcriptional LysR family regulator
LFVAVADAGSLSKAAIMTDRPQSVLSRQITALEESCGCALFHRTGRGVVLTEAAQSILPRIRALLADADDILLSLRSRAGVPTGRVSVGLLPSLDIARDLVAAADELYPEVQLHLTEGSTGQLAEAVAMGRVDLAVLMREPGAVGPTEELLAAGRIYLVGPPGDTLTAAETVPLASLDGLRLFMARPPNAFRIHVEQTARKHGLAPNFSTEVDTLSMQKSLVAAGRGWTVTSEMGARVDVSNGRLQAAMIVDPPLELPVVLVSTTQRPATLAMRRVSELIRRLCRDGILRR